MHAEIVEATSIQSELWPFRKKNNQPTKKQTKKPQPTNQIPNNNKVG